MSRLEKMPEAMVRKLLMGKEVQIDGSGNKGRIVSLCITSDGYITGRTSPGYDRGVFLGAVPEREVVEGQDVWKPAGG